MFFKKPNKVIGGLRFRLTLVYSTLFGFFICVFAFIISNQYMDLARRDFDAALLNFGVDLSNYEVIKSADFQSGLKIPRNESRKVFPFTLGAAVYTLRSIDGEVMAKSPDSPPEFDIPYRSDLPRSKDYTHRFLSIIYKKKNYRAVNIKITNSEEQVRILQVATPSYILNEQEDRLILLNLLTIPFLILISSVASYIISGNALIPIKVLTKTANNIAAENLSLRVPEIKTGDEVAELSRTFNNLLERLEKSFKGQENFVANASHQLNTPLSIIKGELDILESKPRTQEEEAKFRKSLREELERLIDLVKKLLLISRVEGGHGNFVMVPIRIDELLLNTTSRLGGRAREKKITIRFNIGSSLEEKDLIINGDRQLLDAMFENVLENAIKYSPHETVVTIDVEKDPHSLEVAISDEGPGIRAKEWEAISHGRFKRGEEIALPGTGIGLSIVQSIAELHGAQLSYRPKETRGSNFVLAFSQQKPL